MSFLAWLVTFVITYGLELKYCINAFYWIYRYRVFVNFFVMMSLINYFTLLTLLYFTRYIFLPYNPSFADEVYFSNQNLYRHCILSFIWFSEEKELQMRKLHHGPCLLLWWKKNLYHSVFDLFPLTYMCVDIDFRLFSE